MRTDTKRLAVIKLGSSRITGLLCYRDDSGALVPLATSERPTGGSFRFGMVSNTKAVADIVDEVLGELRDKTLEDHEYFGQVFVGIEGISMRTYYETVSLDLQAEGELVTAEHISTLKAQAEAVQRDGLRVIYMEQPYVSLDGMHERNYLSVRAKRIEATFPFVCIKEEYYSNIRNVFEERLELEITGIIPIPLAEARRSLMHTELLLGTAYINIGGGTTSIVVIKEDLLSALYVLPIGGRNVTLDISNQLSLLEGDAEELKLSHISLDLSTDRDKEIEARAEGEESGRKIKISEVNRYAHARMREIVANVQHLLGQSGLEEEVKKNPYVFSGGGTKIKGFDEFIQKQLDRPLRIARILRSGISEGVTQSLLEKWFTEFAIASMVADVDCICRVERSLSELGVAPEEPKPLVEVEPKPAPEPPTSELKFSEVTRQASPQSEPSKKEEGDLFAQEEDYEDEELVEEDEVYEEEPNSPLVGEEPTGSRGESFFSKIGKQFSIGNMFGLGSSSKEEEPTYTDED